MRFQRECGPDIFDEMIPLLEKHYLEIAHFKDIKFEPDYDQYRKIDEIGCLRTFTARDEESKLVGYAVFFVKSNLHYKSSLQAVQDVIYLERSKRGAGIGKDFVAWCDGQLKNDGCEVVYHHVKEKHNFGPMLESLGYQLVDLIFARRLN